MGIDIPDDLADGYREAPVVDIYDYGPWRVPEGLFESIRDKANALAADQRFAHWNVEGIGSYYAAPTNGVGPTIDFILDTLMGGGAIRSGFWGAMVYVMTDAFAAKPPPRRPSWDFYPTQGPQWSPPGRGLLRGVGEQRRLALLAEREILDLFAGFEPIERRRQALIRLWDHQLEVVDPEMDTEELIRSWRAGADAEVLAAVPEMGGPVAFLHWVVAGLIPVHEALLAAVGSGTDIEQMLAELLIVADIDPPAALAAAIGVDRFARVNAAHVRAKGSFDKSAWRVGTSRWLGRAAAFGHLRACRAWLDMAERFSASCNGLPDLPAPPRTRWVPVRTFEEEIRELLSAPVITNPLAETFSARSAPAPSAPRASSGALPTASLIVGQPELSAALAELPETGPIRLFLAGPSGSGQGLAVSAVAEALAARGLARTPAWLPASLFTGKDVGQSVELLRTEIGGASGRGLLVLDGLDTLIAQGGAGVAVAEELRRLGDGAADLHVVALCDTGGYRQIFGVNPALASGFRVVGLRDFDAATFATLFGRALGRLGATATGPTLRAAGDRMAAARPFRNMRNGYLVDAVAVEAVAAARKRTGSDRPRVRVADLPVTSAAQRAMGAPAGSEGGDPYAELEGLVGLEVVKHEVRLLGAEARIAKMRQEAEVAVKPPTRHLAFTGSPGTAKTTVARLIARIYQDAGLLSSGHIVEVSRVDLVAGYIGQTAPKVRAAVERAIGGVLFIDEAYALAGATANDYGGEAVATLVKLMEEHREDLVVIVAGYEREMGTFLASNSGLASRFGRRMHFPDYTDGELLDIFEYLAAADGLTLEPGARDTVAGILRNVDRDARFGNGRFVRNLLDTALANQALRLTGTRSRPDAAEIRTVLAADLAGAVTTAPQEGSTGQYL